MMRLYPAYVQVENWDDLRFLLAVHRNGTLTAAARALGVDQTTVTRRLRALEEHTGSELCEKLRGGVVFTSLGAEMVATAERLEAEMLDLEVRALGGQSEMEGPVRITMPSGLAIELMEDCRDFARAFPGIELELIAADELHNISRREADIALRVASRMKVPDHLVGRKVSPMALAVFGVPALVDVPWERCPWVGHIGTFAEPSIIETHRQANGSGPWIFKADNNWAIIEATRAGAGVTVLPWGCPRLTRGLVALTEPEIYGDIWILTHPELTRNPRIRATLDYWYGVMDRRAAAFAGGH